MRSLGEVLSRLARLAETTRGVAIVFGLALAVWWIEALVIPLNGGRDLATYLGTYAQLFQRHPVDLGYILDRTPLAPLVVGGLLDFAHGALAEPVMSLLYAGSIVAWFLCARVFGGRAALLTAVVLVLSPGYGILFHELSSDAVFAAAFAGWALLAVRTIVLPTLVRFGLVGAGVGVLAYIRPGNTALLALVLIPIFMRSTWRTRALSALAFVAPAVALIVLWTVHNGVLYGDYTFARGGDATIPFYRTFVTDRIVRPTNGPASRELADDVQRDLLPKQPYRAYGITLQDFFAEASPRMQTDLVALSDRLKGFDTNDRWLRDVGVEAVRSHTGHYARGVVHTIFGLLTEGLYRTQSAPSASSSATPNTPTVAVGGKRLPQPTEGEPIPAPHEGGVATPDHSIYTVWTSSTQHHLVFVHPGQEQRYIALHRRMDDLATNFPHRRGSPSFALRMNQASRWYPPGLFWLLLAVGAFALRRPRRSLALWVPAIAGLIVVVLSALGLPAEPHYSVPVAPAFVFLAGGALFAPGVRRERAQIVELARRSFGFAIGCLAAAWAALIYSANLDGTVGVGHDLAVFLGAAGKVVAGGSPYSYSGDRTFAYPPLLGFLAEPFHALSPKAAAIAWTLVLLATIAIALWLLGVRDWRCYALTAIYPTTRSCIDLGTIGPLLLLGIAVAWRWRDRVVAPAVGLGAAVALKLFVWPLVLWFVLTRRVRSGIGTIGFTVALLFIPWAGIGFAGLGHFPGILSRLSRHEASSSYSVIALGVRAHLPEVVALAVSIVVAAALLAAAVWVARNESIAPRDRDIAVLTLTLATALAASPIVWMHYFLLLLVPLALTRPRLSLLWFVPLAYYPLGEAAWPAGDARKLGIGLAATLVVLFGSLLPAIRAARRPARAAGRRESAATVEELSRAG